MQTGENEQALRKIIDMTRMMAIVLLMVHFYFYCYGAFKVWGVTAKLSDKVLQAIANTGLFRHFLTSKLIALGLLLVSLIGARGKKDEKLKKRTAINYCLTGLLLYFGGVVFFHLSMDNEPTAALYILSTSIGFILILAGATLISRLLIVETQGDVFNSLNETFPQEERLLENEHSINLPAIYMLRGKKRQMWINIINPFRGIFIQGQAGSGKSKFLIENILKTQLSKGYSMLLYDFKYDDLSKIAYNYFLKFKHLYPGKPEYHSINFSDLNRSSRCNPLAPYTMNDITDATESATTLMLGLNMDWIEKMGDFFVLSPINFVASLIWYLKRYKGGRYCTLAHVIELAQVPYKKLFSVLRCDDQLSALITPFINAYLHGAMEQLEGQIASATISLAKLSSPELYYILTGNDLNLEINDPASPKVLCLGNNPQKTQIFGAVLSLYINTINRLVNRKGRHKLSEIFDEFATLVAGGVQVVVNTGRSNLISVTIAIQDSSQLKLSYGKDLAEVFLNICGNILSGAVTGESAKHLSDRFGKIMQDRESIAINSSDTSITKSKQLDTAIPVSKISNLSSGEFVGAVADNPDQPIELKTFCSKVQLDFDALKREEDAYQDLPQKNNVTQREKFEVYMQVKKDVDWLVESELTRMMDSPELEHLVIKK